MFSPKKWVSPTKKTCLHQKDNFTKKCFLPKTCFHNKNLVQIGPNVSKVDQMVQMGPNWVQMDPKKRSCRSWL